MRRSTLLICICLFSVLAAFLAGCEQPEGTSSAPESSGGNSEALSAVSSADSSAEESAVSEISLIEFSETSSAEVSEESGDESEESSFSESSVDVSMESSEEISYEESREESSVPEVSDDTRTGSVTHEAPDLGDTFTGLPSLEQIAYLVKDADNTLGLDTDKVSFSFGVASGGKPHNVTVNNQKTFDGYGTNALAWDNKSEEKVLYLTFDCGYKYKDLVDRILDTLGEKDVPAAFFCTMDYLEDAPEAVVRMIEEGHIVGNHSTTHPVDSSALSREKLAWELLGVENYLRENFGYTSKYFRFPGGVYSECALELVNSVGCRSVFWSIAHADWDPENQPGVDVSFKTITDRLHPGAVILLHSTSPDNVAILADYIDYCRAQGYTFRSLDEYSAWNTEQ